MGIKKGNRADAFRMLQCLAVTVRSLTVAELAELLAFEFDAIEGGIPKLNSKCVDKYMSTLSGSNGLKDYGP